MKKKVNWYAIHEARMCLLTGVAIAGGIYTVVKTHLEAVSNMKQKIKNKWEAFKEEEKPEEIRIVIVRDEETPR